MIQKQLTFAIFGNTYQASKSRSIASVLGILRRFGARILVEESFFAFIQSARSIPLDGITPFQGGAFQADFVISMGGDGTLLRSAMEVRDKQTPIIGINTGRLGFLAGISGGDLEAVFHRIYEGEYTIERHSALNALSNGIALRDGGFALNEIAILKRDNASMISIRCSLDSQELVTYHADGLIIATPTGSTAYSLSNGGPIIAPTTGTLCLTPVAPHSLSLRPLVISDQVEIGISVESRSHNFLLAMDGRSMTCREGTPITVRRAPYEVRLVRQTGHTFIETLQEKMMWGMDRRE